MLEILMYFALGFYFMSPKWTRTKYLHPYRPIDAYHLYRGATGSSAHILKFSLQLAVFLLCMAMRILFSTFWFAIFIFRVLKCEVVTLINIPWLVHMACLSVISGTPCLHRGSQLACVHALCDAHMMSLHMQ